MKKMKKNKRERSLPQPTSPAQRHASSLRSPIERAAQRDPAGPLPRAQRAFSLRPKSFPPPTWPSAPPPTRPAAAHVAPSPLGCLHARPSSRPPFPGRQAKSAQRPGRAPSPFSCVHAATRAHAAPHASVGAPSRRQEHCSSSPNCTKRFSRPRRHFCAHISRFSLSTSRTHGLPPSIFPAPASRSLPASSRRRGTQPARRPAVRPIQPPLLHPRRGQPARVRASVAANLRGGQPAR
jgi:hypothetical protein